VAEGFVSYDTVPYPGRAYPQTHPDRLATIATLLGLTPAAVDRCRILEIGCGDAANIVPMAYTLPDSYCLGVDQAALPLERGRSDAAALGLSNLVLEHADLCDLREDLGHFDYIIAHGLYSWVPRPVRDGLLALVRRHLQPHGVAFVSYNVYPGFYARQMLREMMLFHAGAIAEPEKRAEQALAFAGVIARGALARDEEGAALLDRALKRLASVPIPALLHDDLASTNVGVYFCDFAQHAGDHGLQFLAEADYFEMRDDLAPDDLKTQLRALADAGEVIRREQLLDFLKGRTFRQTLLCHSERQLDMRGAAERVKHLWASAALSPSESVDLNKSVEVRFTSPRGHAVVTAEPLAKATLSGLADRYPERLTFDALVESARARLSNPRAQDLEHDRNRVAELLWQCFSGGVVALHVWPSALVREPGPLPEVTALARLQARRGSDVTTLVHGTAHIGDDVMRRLLILLDGTRNGAALGAEWSALLDATEHSGTRDDSTREARLAECLTRIGKMALFLR
jgi:SAM-dependent methyltransferase